MLEPSKNQRSCRRICLRQSAHCGRASGWGVLRCRRDKFSQPHLRVRCRSVLVEVEITEPPKARPEDALLQVHKVGTYGHPRIWLDLLPQARAPGTAARGSRGDSMKNRCP